MTMNKTVRLARRPHGEVQREDFAIAEEALSDPAEGQFRVRSAYVSLDPAMRGWMNDSKSYVPPVGIGEVMRGFVSGTVDASRNPKFKEGDTVSGIAGRAVP